MINPTLVGENSFGEFDGVQFARFFPGVVLRDTSGKFPDPTSGLISYYSMFAKLLNTF